MESLAKLSADLMSASLSSYGKLLAKRRALLDQLAARQVPPYRAEELVFVLRAGRDASSQLLVELGALRAKIEDLRRLRAGLGQLRPIQAATPSLDVLL
jgi:hypothetical protein